MTIRYYDDIRKNKDGRYFTTFKAVSGTLEIQMSNVKFVYNEKNKEITFPNGNAPDSFYVVYDVKG